MAEVVGVVAAALQFADLTRKVLRLAREVQAGAEPGPIHRKITQLETFAEIADKISKTWTQDDVLTERILKQCIPTVEALSERLQRVEITDSDGLRSKTKKALLIHWGREDVEELFSQLRRDQMALLMHRSFTTESHLAQKIIDSMSELLDEKLKYLSAENDLERDFLSAMFITDPRDDRSALISRKGRRVEGTCTWVTETDAYRLWLSTAATSPGLLLEGGPGKGKTIIAIYLTEQLELITDRGHSTIYFFCDNRNPKQNNALAVMRCLIWQLCRLKPTALAHGTKELKERGSTAGHLLGPTPSTGFETLWRIFEAMLRDPTTGMISCVIDGLDECDEESIFLILDRLWGLTGLTSFKFLILSRPLGPRQQRPANHGTVVMIRLDPDSDEQVYGDIDEFIRQRVNEVANSERQWSEALRQYVETTLRKKAGGTFLWVGFITQDLRRLSGSEVKSYLKKLPVGLNGIYDRILQELPPSYRSRLRQVLHWVCMAEHPLSLSELVGLISEDDSSTEVTSTDSDAESESNAFSASDLEILDDLLAFLAHFILVSEDTVYFVHQSAKDYLMRSGSFADPDLEYFRIDKRAWAHEQRAIQCFDILESQLPLITKEEGWGSDDYEYTSFHYAVHFWPHHIRHSGESFKNPDTMFRLLRFFDRTELLHDRWKQSLGKRASVFNAMDDRCTISQLINLGFKGTFDSLIRSMNTEDYAVAVTATQETKNRPLGTALAKKRYYYFDHILDMFGCEAVALEPAILEEAIDAGGDEYLRRLLTLAPDSRRLYGDQLDGALAKAVLSAHIEDIKMLIEFGANVYASGWQGGNYLHNAVRRSRLRVARFLLSLGVDPAGTNEAGDTALHIAARSKDIEWVQFLLDLGISTAATNLKGRTPLHEAMFGDPSIKTAKTLAEILGGRTVIDVQDLHGQTVLHYTAARDTPDILRALLRHQPDVNLQDERGQTALHLAAAGRFATGSVQLLLHSGAAVNFKNAQGREPLHLAAESGRAFSVEALVSSKVEVDCVDGQRLTPLHLAVKANNLPSLKALLNAKADVHCVTLEGRTALHLAAQFANESIAEILVDHGAHVNQTDEKGMTPFLLVIEGISGTNPDENYDLSPRASYIDWLRTKGAEVKKQDIFGRTALHLLAQKMHSRAEAITAREAREKVAKDAQIARIQAEKAARDAAQVQKDARHARSLYGKLHCRVDQPLAATKRRTGFNDQTHLNESRGAVSVILPLSPLSRPFRGYGSYDPGSHKTDLDEDEMTGIKVRQALERCFVDMNLKDVHGRVARDYHPVDDFWDGNGYPKPGSRRYELEQSAFQTLIRFGPPRRRRQSQETNSSQHSVPSIHSQT